jgi:hypothetical protein
LVPSGANLSKHYAGFRVSMLEYHTEGKALTEADLSDYESEGFKFES